MAGSLGRYHQILESFTRHIAEIGYHDVNFGMVAAELGISKGTIVHHFGTKERILAAIHESYMRRRLAELDMILEWLDDPGEQLAAILHAFVRYQVEDREAAQLAHRDRKLHVDDAIHGAGQDRDLQLDRVRVPPRDPKRRVDFIRINGNASRHESDLVEPVSHASFAIAADPHSHD